METFDVFSGTPEQDPLWLETTRNLNEARERMKERARTKRGPYFVYCCEIQQVMDSVDTSDFVAEAPHAGGGSCLNARVVSACTWRGARGAPVT